MSKTYVSFVKTGTRRSYIEYVGQDKEKAKQAVEDALASSLGDMIVHRRVEEWENGQKIRRNVLL